MSSETDGQTGSGTTTALPASYPQQYSRDVLVRGRPLRFRPVHPGDNDLMIRLFNTFSKETIFHRFFTYMKVSNLRVSRFTTVDYKRHMAIVAEEIKDGHPQLVAVARYNTPMDEQNQGAAEFAIVVGDPWQGRGIGVALMNYLLHVAHDEGFLKLFGIVHYDNHAMPGLFEQLERAGIHHSCRDTCSELRFEIDVSQPIPETYYSSKQP